MPQLVDIHAHILPRIDDGPSSLEDAVRMAHAAAHAGIETLAATPHLRGDFPAVDVNELAERTSEVAAAVAGEGLGLELVSGGELSLVWALNADAEQLRLASYGQRGSDLLVETPSQGGVVWMLRELGRRGFRLTLAHPERGPEFQRDLTLLRELVDEGVLLQVNSESLLGGQRTPSRRLARRLCREGLAHVLASDGHRAESWRPVGLLAEAVPALAGIVGKERARWMSYEMPRAILLGERLPSAPPMPPAPPLRRLLRWL